MSDSEKSLGFYYNGLFYDDKRDLLSIQDRGLLLGDGVFETLRCVGSALEFLAEHISRLNTALKALRFEFSLAEKSVRAICDRLLKNVRATDIGVVRITVTRGISKRGLLPVNSTPTVLITHEPYVPFLPQSLALSAIRRHSSAWLYRYKTINYLENIMARYAAVDQGADDALFLDEQDCLLSTSTANIFLWQNKRFITPPLTAPILPGIMRQQWINYCERLGFTVAEKPVLLSDLAGTKAILITNSLLRVQTIAEIQGHWRSKEDNGELSKLIAGFNQLLP